MFAVWICFCIYIADTKYDNAAIEPNFFLQKWILSV